MKAVLAGAALALLVAAPLATPAQAKGCIKGALVGGTAGHFVHHGWLGAAAGCLIGHHEANKHARQQNMNSTQGSGSSSNTSRY